jgi:hypothetical protein
MPLVYECSRCGSITKSQKQFKREAKHWLWPTSYYVEKYDLCSSCSKELDLFLEGCPVWTDSDARKVESLQAQLAAEKEVTARWERLAREKKEVPKTPS